MIIKENIHWADARRGVVALGECLVELRADGDQLTRGFAGDTLNTLVYLNRIMPLQTPAPVYATALGRDPISDTMLAWMKEEGINTRLVRRFRNKLPGLYQILTDDAGERSFLYWRSDSAARCMFDRAYTDRLSGTLATAGLFFFSGISLAILPNAARQRLLALMVRLNHEGVIIAFDSNYRAALWRDQDEARFWIDAVLQCAQIVLPGFADEHALYGDVDPEATANRLQQYALKEIILKDGTNACHVWTSTEQLTVPVMNTVTAADTTGAGDAFNAGYLAGRIDGMSVEQACHVGHRLAARVVRIPGALLPRGETPTLQQLGAQ